MGLQSANQQPQSGGEKQLLLQGIEVVEIGTLSARPYAGSLLENARAAVRRERCAMAIYHSKMNNGAGLESVNPKFSGFSHIGEQTGASLPGMSPSNLDE